MLGQLELSDRIATLVERVRVVQGGLSAESAGETYEAQTPHALARQLGYALYQTLHSGRDKPLDAMLRTWRQAPFDALLAEATGPRTTAVPGRAVRAEEGHTIVDLDGVRVQVPDTRVAAEPTGDVRVTLPSARPGLSPGFFLTTASRGRHPDNGLLLRLYARLDDPDAAAPVWHALVGFLEDEAVPYRAKISSSRLLYPRNDAVVIYLPRPAWRVARSCADLLQGTGLLGVGTSPFTHPLTGSVGCAFEPDDQRPGKKDLSFGQHRTRVFAEALVTHATLAHDERGPATQSIAAAFVDAGIDPAEPARNLASPIVSVLRTY